MTRLLSRAFLYIMFFLPYVWTNSCLGQVTFNDYGSSGIYGDKIETIKSSLPSELTKIDIVITIGLSALQHQLTIDDTRPIISLFVPSHTFQQATINIPDKRKVTAIYADPNPNDLIQLAIILSKSAKILIPYTSETLSLLPADHPNATSLFLTPGDTRSLISATDQYDIVLALPDKTLYNATTIQPIVSSLYRRKKFIISYSVGMLNSGALASIIIDTPDLISGLEHILQSYNSNAALPPATFSNSFSVSVNRKLAASLDINPMEENLIAQKIRSHGASHEN